MHSLSISPASQILTAVAYGGGTAIEYVYSRSILQGRSHFFCFLSNIFQLNCVVRVANQFLATSGKSLSERVVNYFPLCLSGGIYFLTTLKVKNVYLKTFIYSLEKHVGTLSVISFIAVTGLRLYLNLYLELISASLLFGLTIANEHNCFPPPFSGHFSRFLHSAFLVGQVVLNTSIIRIVCALELFSEVNQLFYSDTFYEEEPAHRVTIQELERRGKDQYKNIFTEDVYYALHTLCADYKYKVNWSHLNKRDILPAMGNTDVPLTEFTRLFDRITWNRYWDDVRVQLQDDVRLKELGFAATKEENENEKINSEIAYVRNNFMRLIDSIQQRNIQNKMGTAINYELVSMYCDRILRYCLEKEREWDEWQEKAKQGESCQEKIRECEAAIAYTLSELAIQGGEYCSDGKLEAIENCAFRNMPKKGLSLDERISLTLQAVRKTTVQHKYTEIVRYFQFLFFLDRLDLHLFNHCVSAYDLGRIWGLPSLNGQKPIFSFLMKNCKLIKLLYPLNPEITYNQSFIVNYIEEMIGHAGISKASIYDWWHNWIDRQELDDKEKNELHDELNQKCSIKKIPFEIENPNDSNKPIINHLFLVAMLQEMGILSGKQKHLRV